jgi:hypothetical protein
MSRGHINEEEKNDRFDARKASMDADLAEAYALDAIDFAQAAVDEAESATLDAMYRGQTLTGSVPDCGSDYWGGIGSRYDAGRIVACQGLLTCSMPPSAVGEPGRRGGR